jgi:hypothetical protein
MDIIDILEWEISYGKHDFCYDIVLIIFNDFITSVIKLNITYGKKKVDYSIIILVSKCIVGYYIEWHCIRRQWGCDHLHITNNYASIIVYVRAKYCNPFPINVHYRAQKPTEFHWENAKASAKHSVLFITKSPTFLEHALYRRLWITFGSFAFKSFFYFLNHLFFFLIYLNQQFFSF